MSVFFGRTKALAAFLAVVVILPVAVRADEAADNAAKVERRARTTAVALNYCRASFHRIRKYESTQVILEERDKILNNLNLNGIGNEEVIKLYSAVLDEMSQVEIADLEKEVYQEKYKKSLARQVGTSLFIMSAELATISMQNMVRTGVNSWLDYRDTAWTRELDQFKLEKERIQAVVSKSSRFLDTFWKLAQENEIPDRWLIRGTELDQLMVATQEEDLTKRLRILTRMKPYMECYPPYWYYLARTQQGLGQLIEAADTFEELDKVADGHFRRDDMLAASLANLAMIRSHLGRPGAEDAAREALAKSSAVWEANLMCAQVLEKAGEIPDAEDAILRNLDVNLERSSSSVALVGLLYRQNELTRLGEALSDEDLLASLPILSLVQCMQKLGPARTPPAVAMKIRESLRVAVEPRFGQDDLIIACSPGWQSHFAQVSALTGDRTPLEKPELTVHPSGDQMLRFRRVVDGTGSLSGMLVEFQYPDPSGGRNPTRLQVRLGAPVSKSGPQAAPAWWTAASPSDVTLAGVGVSLIGETLPAPLIAAPPAAGIRRPGGTGPINPVFPTRPDQSRTATNDRDANTNGTQGDDRGSRPEATASDRKVPRARILGVRPIPLPVEKPLQVPPPPE
ncbi:MAG: hypothetical protein O2820_21960 [Planctomycetota bacterium]|nr:hypothetical protein [Planctomycetota bacterium]MDA1251885.1 hypothetical protein [Planctomycetota bacterium]